jgi:hypothetical protein
MAGVKRHKGKDKVLCGPNVKYELDHLTRLCNAVLDDISNILDVNLGKDIEVINTRVRHEGICFLTKTLPIFAKEILRSLRLGVLELPDDFPFKRKRRSGVHPAFLQDILIRIFTSDGYVRSDADPQAVWAVEQICFLFYKYELPFKPAELEKAYRGVQDVNESLSWTLAGFGVEQVSEEGLIFEVARGLCCDLLDDFMPGDILPRHGKGSTAEGTLKPIEKYNFTDLPDSVEEIFPKSEYFSVPGRASHLLPVPLVFSGAGVVRRAQTEVRESSPISEPVARICAVPKDSRGPRIISAEPKELMWLQQGIWAWLRRRIESHPLTAGHVNFTNQAVNRDIALSSSEDGAFATIDMKEASDRVSLTVVAGLMPSKLIESLMVTRSIYNRFPDGKEIRLRKFAPMGSAVCFPVEALVFWSLVVGTLVRIFDMSVQRACKSVYIYGDDIIVPSEKAVAVIDSLERFGLLCNREKSYWSGSYRESCGVDAFKGVNVTPIKIKKRLPQQRRDVEGIVSWVKLSNQFYDQGMWSAAFLIQKYIEKSILHCRLPVLPRNSNGLGWYSNSGDIDPMDRRWIPARRVVTRRKVRGGSFNIVETQGTNLGPYALKIKGLVLKTLRYEIEGDPSVEEKLYLRRLTNPSAESSRIFSDRYVTKMERGWIYFT